MEQWKHACFGLIWSRTVCSRPLLSRRRARRSNTATITDKPAGFIYLTSRLILMLNDVFSDGAGSHHPERTSSFQLVWNSSRALVGRHNNNSSNSNPSTSYLPAQQRQIFIAGGSWQKRPVTTGLRFLTNRAIRGISTCPLPHASPLQVFWFHGVHKDGWVLLLVGEAGVHRFAAC